MDKDKKEVYICAIITCALLIAFCSLLFTWYYIDHDAYQNGYVPYDRGDGFTKLVKKQD